MYGTRSETRLTLRIASVFHRNVPYNPLLDQGYRSIGDWHSTAKPTTGTTDTDAGERAGRWQGKKKSECGLHKDYFEMKRAFEEKRKEAVEVAQENGVEVEA